MPIIIRTVTEMKKVMASNPFLKQKGTDIERLFVTFLADTPNKTEKDKIEKLDYSPDNFIMNGKEIYLYCPNGYGRTKLNNNFFENKLKVTATTRNWNTVNKLVEMGEEL